MNYDSELLHNLIKKYYLDKRDPDRFRRVIRKIERGKMGPKDAKRWLKRIIPLVEEQEIRGNYLPAAGTFERLGLDEKPFDVTLGRLIERPSIPIGVYLSSGVFHIAVCGKPGSGKSVFIRLYLKRGYEYGLLHPDNKISFIFFDSKNDIHNPELIFGQDFIHIKVRQPDKNRFAFNGPPNVPVSAWAAWLCTAVGARMTLIVSRTSLSQIYTWLTPLLNPQLSNNGINVAPSPQLMLDTLTNSPNYCWGEKIDYIKFLTQMLEAIILDAGGMFDAERGFDVIQDVLMKGTNCVINIANFEPAYLRYLICDIIILQLLTYHIHNHLKTTKTRICLCFDEADFFVRPSAQDAYPDSLSPITILARIAREYGIQICIAVSGLQNVAPYLLTGVDCLVALGSVDSESIRQAQLTFGIEKGVEKLLPSLTDGKCIYRNASTAYPYPMLAQIDFIEPDHSAKRKPYHAIPFTPARRLKDLPHIQDALKERIKERKQTALKQSKNQNVSYSLANKQRQFLDLICIYEYEPAYRTFERMDVTSNAYRKKIIDGLVDAGLIEAPQIRTGKSFVRIARPTKEGWGLAQKQSKYGSLGASFEHDFMCHSKRRHDVKKGAKSSLCQRQLEGTNHIADVLSVFGGQLVCSEIINNCTSNICEHVKACFIDTKKVSKLDIVTLLKSTHQKVQQKILSDPQLTPFIGQINFTSFPSILEALYGK